MSVFDLHERVGRLLLASGSPRRLELLRDAGFEPLVVPQDIDETPKEGEAPEAYVERLAYQKAVSARAQAQAGDVILAADTTVAIDGVELGKPASEGEARAMLAGLSGHVHTVATGVCLITGVGDMGAKLNIRSFVDTAQVEFYELADADIAAYIATGEPMDKAGAYGIQGKGRLLVKRIDGDYYTVVGLPVARTLRVLDEML